MSQKSVIVGGIGLIGSHVVPHLGRMPNVGSVKLIDPDYYEEKNLLSQDISIEDVGKPKASVQADRLARVNKGLRVEVIQDVVENVPLGMLKADVILGGFDNNAARRIVSEAAWRLSVPYVDGGVNASGMLARANVYIPGTDEPCLQCAWDQRDYELLEQHYSCNGTKIQTAPTNAPSTLGSLCASLVTIEAGKILSGQWDRIARGKQVLIDAGFHMQYVTRFPRNPRCRFDHETWDVLPLEKGPDTLSIKEALVLAPGTVWDASLSLAFRGRVFCMRTSHCGVCDAQTEAVSSVSELPKDVYCTTCGVKLSSDGFRILPALKMGELPMHLLERSVGSVGFRAGDVLLLETSLGPRYFELGSSSC